MKRIKLHPVRTNEWRNHWLKWPRSKQVAASMLLWASRAHATQIIFDPTKDQTLVYSNATDDNIVTELPEPPQDVAETYLGFLQDLAAGGSWLGLFRPNVKFVSGSDVNVRIVVPDIETGESYNWVMSVGDKLATFNFEDTS